MGAIFSPETMTGNYHSTLHNISEEHTSHKMIWWCNPWFGFPQSGSEQSGWHFLCKFKKISHI